MPERTKIEIPQAPESERVVLGSVIIGGSDTMKRIAHILTYQDFYDSTYRYIYRAMEYLFKEQKDIDVVTLADVLRTRGYLDEIGGPATLTDLSSDIASVAHVVTHAKIVADRATLRNIIRASQDIIKLTQKEGDLDALLNEAEARLKGVTKSSARSEQKLATVDIEEWRKTARDTQVAQGTVRGLSTGLKGLDDVLEGMEPGEMIILTGHTKHGKSRLAANVAANVAQAGHNVLFINTEMTKLQTARRFNQILGDEPIKGKIMINDRAGLEHRDVIHLMERAKEKGCDMVIVDHLHFFSRSVDNQTNEISKITKDFKDAAIDFELPLLMLAHVQQGDTRKVPSLQMLKNSSSIAQDADVVITVWLDDRPNGDNSYTDVIRLAHRSANRSIRKVKLYNDGMKMTENAPDRTANTFAEDTARMLGERDDLDLDLEELDEGDEGNLLVPDFPEDKNS